ncbi:MAG: heme-binding protein [Candidatus Hydrogenedentes bacterium]|nr:heme-binding protein [Candidatus Hydrogenedentota bacterium]
MRSRVILAAALACAVAAGFSAMWPGVEAGETAPAVAGADIDLAGAQRVVDAALKKAAAIDTKMDIAVVDAGANLKAFVRMDGAWLGSIDIAIKKAKTARFFDMNTGEIGKLSQPGGPLYNIEHSNGGLISFPGGVPLKNAAGEVIGAIGVSGSTVENDHAVAVAGAAAL